MPHELNLSSNASCTKGASLLPADAAAARAKSRFNTCRDGCHSLTYEKGGMHPRYLNVLLDKDHQQVIADCENDAFDAVRTLYFVLWQTIHIMVSADNTRPD
jgi:hypothetical protein